MEDIIFDWDPRKAKYNYKEHRIHFSEASTVFFDENAKDFYDPEHSEEEDRFLMLGMSRSFRVLIVSYCYRESEKIIRIISSRKADKKETMAYFAGGRK